MGFKYYSVIGILLLSNFLSLESGPVNTSLLCKYKTICKPVIECPILEKTFLYMSDPPYCDLHNEKVRCPMLETYSPPDLTNSWSNACNRYGEILKNKSLEKPFVLNGTEARPHEFPFMALIGKKDETKTGGIHWFCGGTLITPRWVLTAAHCFWDEKNRLIEKTALIVRLGEHDYSVNKNDTQDFDNVNYISSFAYKDDLEHPNDIGLIDLKRNATLNWNVLPACLPTMKNASYKYFEAAGWGLTQSGNSSTKLLKARLYPANNCKEHYDLEEEDNNKICAINDQDGQDTCKGDSGGPLFVSNPEVKGTYKVVGITSYGVYENCGDRTEDDELPPAYYTNVAAHMSWIKTHITEI